MNTKCRLDKMLADRGIATRSDLRSIIRRGRVQVNGVVAKDPGMHILPEIDVVILDGKTITYKKTVWYGMNKPKGVITATEDAKQTTVLDLFPEEIRRMGVFPVGRLDRDTEGLLLFTTDGVKAHAMLTPKKHVEKCYEAVLDRLPEPNAVALFSAGIELDWTKCKPAQLTILTEAEVPTAQVVLTEGKFHQVKRMFEAVGSQVIHLKRLRFGHLELPKDLYPGAWWELTDAEVRLAGMDEEE